MNIKLKLLKCVGVATFVLILDYVGVFKLCCELDYEQVFNYPYYGNDIEFVEKNIGSSPLNFYNYSFIHNAENVCDKSKGIPYITFLIKSAPTNIERREAIRRTWGFEQRFSDVSIRRVFLIGLTTNSIQKEIDIETNQYHDIVQANFLDSYFNNTIKTMTGMRWITMYCAHSQYYMFVDDDFYVSLKNVLQFLRHTNNYEADMTENHKSNNNYLTKLNEILYAGHVIQSKPQRHKFSKWFVPLEEYPFNKWPPYITAGAYILSQKALLKLYYASQYTKHFRFDDIYLAILALKAKVKLTHCKEFHFKKPHKIDDYRNVIASHDFGDPNILEKFWNKMHSAGYA